jgi:HEPN domain-containing protein
LSRDEQADLPALLARKAREDAIAVREFSGNAEIADGIIGFHAQQAIEKWLKAVMAHRGMPQARIHDLGRLLQLLRDDGAPLPDDADRLDELTIYAVPLRYDDLLDAEPLDREDTTRLIERTEAWGLRELE